ncbi:MAG: hypothetical protein AB1371_12345 [Pseudomonadota bacterium]
MACEPSRFIAELGDDVRQPQTAGNADAKSHGSAQLAQLKAMLG